MQATVFRYDASSATGSVITDQGLVLPFGADAMAASGLRHLRPGQRLTVTLEDAENDHDPRILALSLGSIVPS